MMQTRLPSYTRSKCFFSISTFNWTPCTERNKATNAITNHRVDWELKMMWIVAGECVIPTAAPRRVDNSRPPFSKKWWIIPWKWAKCIDPLFYILNNSILNGIENKEDERDVRRVVAVHTTSGPKGEGDWKLFFCTEKRMFFSTTPLFLLLLLRIKRKRLSVALTWNGWKSKGQVLEQR